VCLPCRPQPRAAALHKPFYGNQPGTRDGALTEQIVTKEEMIAAMRECAEKMGRAPSFPELQVATKITTRTMRTNFGNYSRMLETCGLERQGAGFKVGMRTLFLEWAGLVRKLGKLPTIREYDANSQFSVMPLTSRFGGWKRVPVAMYYFARKEGLDVEWKDVLDMIAAEMPLDHEPKMIKGLTTLSPREPGIFADRPIYGAPMKLWPMTCAPTNEMGVVFLFGHVAQSLGFSIIRLQTAFPDAEALREMDPGRWQLVHIEFEFESKNFLLHMHEARDCDLIVCWKHNWEDCPLEVLELSKLMDKLM
jgi:Homing endonuclease associated repeat